MEHVVFFPAPDGSPAFKRVGSLEDAVRLVEHLRNIEGVADVSVHSLTEVPMAFRAYYKVEVPVMAEQAASTAAPEAVVPPQGSPEPESAPFMPAAEAPAPPVAADPTVEAAEQGAPLASAEPAFAGAESAGPAAANGHREVTGLGFFAS